MFFALTVHCTVQVLEGGALAPIDAGPGDCDLDNCVIMTYQQWSQLPNTPCRAGP